MTTANLALYQLLMKWGASEAEAQAAASVEAFELVTKADLKAELAELRRDMDRMEVELIKWNLGAMGLLTAIYGAIAVALKLVR